MSKLSQAPYLKLSDVGKRYPSRIYKEVEVLKNISFTLYKGQRLGIIGKNGAGKSTLIRLMGGVERPSSGTIERTMSISWPLAFTGGFQSTLSGLDNLKFVCRIYGVDYEQVMPFVREFSELGSHLYEPIKTYSSGMLARLAFAVSMSIDFDCFLIDEVIAVGDARFRDKCRHELLEVRASHSIILVSHDVNSLKEYCNRYGVISDGRFYEFNDIESALIFHDKA